jgi:pimeloyl-ACP methyl ester carboxylesterase
MLAQRNFDTEENLMTSLVMVHGLFGHLNVPEIHDAFIQTKTTAPDLIGYGEYCDADTSDLSLEDQANHVIAHIEQNHDSPVHLLGHSVGGAVSALVATSRPNIMSSYISVEGNFTLKDTFWSGQIAEKSDAEVEEIVEEYRADPIAWMNGAVDKQTEITSRIAREWLFNQPASTIKAQARAVVAATGQESYLVNMRQLMESDMPVHLLAGSRSAAGWDTPDWANQMCNTRTNIPHTGHLMMIEEPQKFAEVILQKMN